MEKMEKNNNDFQEELNKKLDKIVTEKEQERKELKRKAEEKELKDQIYRNMKGI